MPPKTPVTWVKYEPRRALVACLGLSPGAELAHRRLSDHHWSTQRWTTQAGSQILELTRVSDRKLPVLLRELAAVGWHAQGQHLVNAEVGQIVAEALTFQAASTTRARAAAQCRWGQKPSQPLPEEAAPEPCTSTAPALAEACSSTAPAMPMTDAAAPPDSCHNSTVHNSSVQSGKRERLMLSVSTHNEAAPGESEFFEKLERVLKPTGKRQAGLELTNWGGWWRNRFRAQPDKARRVLAEVHSMLKEGRVRKNAGAAAVDLWARLPDEVSNK